MRRYRGRTSDNARWERFAFRDDDVVISTPSKCGTTWMQHIVGMLILDRTAPEAHLSVWNDPHAFFRVGGRRDWAALLGTSDLDHFRDRLTELAGDATPWILNGRTAL